MIGRLAAAALIMVGAFAVRWMPPRRRDIAFGVWFWGSWLVWAWIFAPMLKKDVPFWSVEFALMLSSALSIWGLLFVAKGRE